jgi:hypothetical protein
MMCAMLLIVFSQAIGKANAATQVDTAQELDISLESFYDLERTIDSQKAHPPKNQNESKKRSPADPSRLIHGAFIQYSKAGDHP